MLLTSRSRATSSPVVTDIHERSICYLIRVCRIQIYKQLMLIERIIVADDILFFIVIFQRNQGLQGRRFTLNVKTFSLKYLNVVCCSCDLLFNSKLYICTCPTLCAKYAYEPTHDKIYNKTCATSEDSDQPAHPHRLIRGFANRMCPLQPPGYQKKKDKREPLPYWVDV